MRIRHRKEPYSPDDVGEKTFLAHIIKGNRQVIKRTVVASKRFRVDEDTYLVVPEMIFLKSVDGRLQSVSYYREGNPMPMDFENENVGIKPDQLDRLFAEDFYFIVTNLEPKNRMVYLLLVGIINLVLLIVFDVGVGMNAIF